MKRRIRKECLIMKQAHFTPAENTASLVTKRTERGIALH